jgi:hypothetical protein
MRTIVAVTLAVAIVLLGLQGMGQLATANEPGANSTDFDNSSYNMTGEVFGGLSSAQAQALPWFGVGAVVLVASGLLVSVAGGRR